MNLPLRIFTALALLTLQMAIACIAFADIQVGNGGEGILLNNKLTLRDFHSGVNRIDLKIGKSISPAFNNSSGKFSNSPFEVSDQLLLRKISDAEDLVPGLGHALLAIINQYCWQEAPFSLWITDDRDALAAPLGIRVPLAVRGSPSLSCISIDQLTWPQLSEIDQIGLIIHEAVSAITPVQCFEVCEQRPELVRAIVRMIFEHAAGDVSSEAAKKYLSSLLSLKWDHTWTKPSQEMISIGTLPDRRAIRATIPLAEFHLSSAQKLFAESVCTAGSSSLLQVQFKRPPFCLYAVTYSKSQVQGQLVYIPQWRTWKYEFTLDSSDVEACKARIIEKFAWWFDTTTELEVRTICP